MFEVGGNMCNSAFQLTMQQCCIASCSNLLLVLLHLKLDIFNPIVQLQTHMYSSDFIVRFHSFLWGKNDKVLSVLFLGTCLKVLDI